MVSALLDRFRLVFLLAAGIFTYFYIKYSRMIDARLSGHVLQNTTQIFSAPERISDGQAWSQDDLVMYLQRVGYRPEADDNSLGEYIVKATRWTSARQSCPISAAPTPWRGVQRAR